MSFKNLITSTCIALVLGTAVCPQAKARHVTNDPAANILDALILVQDIMAVVLKVSDLAESVKRNTSFGDLGAIASGVDFSKNASDLASQVKVTTPKLSDSSSSSSEQAGGANVSDASSEFESEFESATNDASKMHDLVMDVLPSVDDAEQLTDEEKEMRMKKRQAIRNAAISDAYATAVAYQSKKANAGTEVVEPVQDNASGAETQQEKQAAANEVQLAQLMELIENNLLTAELLKLQSAEAMGNLPMDL